MPDNYFASYLPFLIHVLLAGGIATAIISLSWLIGQRKPTRAKMEAYECGMHPVGDSRGRFSVKFYLVAMLFILFDVEAVFSLSLGRDPARSQAFWSVGNVCIHRDRSGGIFLCVEEGRAGLGPDVVRRGHR